MWSRCNQRIMHKAGVHFLMEPNYISIGCHPRDQVPGSSQGTECINQSLGNYTSMDCPENKILALKLIRRDASAGSRTRVYCLEGNYPNRWTTNAADVKSVNHGLTAAHIYTGLVDWKITLILNFPPSPSPVAKAARSWESWWKCHPIGGFLETDPTTPC